MPERFGSRAHPRFPRVDLEHGVGDAALLAAREQLEIAFRELGLAPCWHEQERAGCCSVIVRVSGEDVLAVAEAIAAAYRAAMKRLTTTRA